MKIAIVDLGLGNLRSVEQALKTVADDSAEIVITHQPSQIEQADKIVLPGQGAIGSWFGALKSYGLLSVLTQAFETKPILGICVGMQAMFSHCEEDGGVAGLGLFDGQVRHFRHFHSNTQQSGKLKIPQMGWNQVKQTQVHPLWHNIEDNSYFYFVHSYCANLMESESDTILFGEADYGHKFIASVGRDNVFAVQFHPEKSHRDGLQLLRNFVNWDGEI